MKRRCRKINERYGLEILGPKKYLCCQGSKILSQEIMNMKMQKIIQPTGRNPNSRRNDKHLLLNNLLSLVSER